MRNFRGEPIHQPEFLALVERARTLLIGRRIRIDSGTLCRPGIGNLMALRKGAPFFFGKVVQIHDVGRYSIVEAMNEDPVVHFYPYTDGKDLGMYAFTLEGALLEAMAAGARKPLHADQNGRARFAALCLGLDPE